MSQDGALQLAEGRYARLDAIPWWDRQRLARARVLVIGAGALGNEVVKNLALLGIGDLTIVDMDRIELHNLTRSALFRSADAGRAKAEVLAERARDLSPDCTVRALVGNALAVVGLGWFRRADVVVGALDNREARVFTNQCCARLGRPWIDGGIEVLNGIVRGFHPPATACYECGMSEADWAIIDQRRSCSMLARQAIAARGTPTTPTTASVIGAMQAQEVVKLLHGMDALLGAGFVFEGLNHSSYRSTLPRKPDCPCHEPVAEVVAPAWCGVDTPLARVLDFARDRLGGLDALDLPRELAARLDCAACASAAPCWRPAELLDHAAAACPRCGGERSVVPCHSFRPGQPERDLTLGRLGLPPFDILFARHGERALAIELAADRPDGPTD